MDSIKREFFAFRNGITADILRKAGMPYKVIFGLQIPQIAQIAKQYTPDMNLADKLWDDKAVRESRLLATYLFPTEEMTIEKALELMQSVQTPEESDMLAFRLLKRLPFAQSLLQMAVNEPQIADYAAESLCKHLT